MNIILRNTVIQSHLLLFFCLKSITCYDHRISKIQRNETKLLRYNILTILLVAKYCDLYEYCIVYCSHVVFIVAFLWLVSCPFSVLYSYNLQCIVVHMCIQP